MDNQKLIPLYTGPLEQFPASPELPEGVTEVAWTDEGGNMIEYHLDVVYDTRDGESQPPGFPIYIPARTALVLRRI